MERPFPKVLIIYFSLSGQSRGLINLFASGLRTEGSAVFIEQIKAEKKIAFPFKSFFHTFKMMIATFFRWRIKIRDLSSACFEDYNLIILAGPTWSYNPSGPVLSLIDKYGIPLFAEKRVLPLISCRGYFRIHNFFLRRQLQKTGAVLENSIIFSHPVAEPWSSLGVFFKSAGYSPEKLFCLKNHYGHFGHSVEQLHQAEKYGRSIGQALYSNSRIEPLSAD